MKILYFMNHADQGGAVLALYDLLVELIKQKEIEPIVITGKKNKFNEMLDELQIENYAVSFKNFISSYQEPKWLCNILLWIRYIIHKPGAIQKIQKIIDFQKIDLIHTNLDRIDIGAYFSKKYKIPHVWHIREHLDDDFEVTFIFKNYIKHMEKYPSTYVAISKSVKNKWIKRGIPEHKIRLIYDGIREETFTKEKPSQKTEKIKIIFLGGYCLNKGQEFVIEAVSEMPKEIRNKIQIDFFGNGTQKYVSNLQQKINTLGIQDIVQLNQYDPAIYEKLKNYQIGMNCSKSEGFGRITVEYMLAGLCPIASNTGANPEIIENQKSRNIIYLWR